MSATVLPFPGAQIRRPVSRPSTLADLPPGAKALAIVPYGTGFAVVMRPAVTAKERGLRSVFRTKAQAEHYARIMSTAYFMLYRLILDETGTVGGAA